jgi:hypothetical protein
MGDFHYRLQGRFNEVLRFADDAITHSGPSNDVLGVAAEAVQKSEEEDTEDRVDQGGDSQMQVEP